MLTVKRSKAAAGQHTTAPPVPGMPAALQQYPCADKAAAWLRWVRYCRGHKLPRCQVGATKQDVPSYPPTNLPNALPWAVLPAAGAA